MRRQQFSIYN